MIPHPRYKTSVLITPEIRKEMQDVMDYFGWSQYELGRELSLTNSHINLILRQKYSYVRRTTYNRMYPLLQAYLEQITKPEPSGHVVNRPSNPETEKFLLGRGTTTQVNDLAYQALHGPKPKRAYNRKKVGAKVTLPPGYALEVKNPNPPGFLTRLWQVFFP